MTTPHSRLARVLALLALCALASACGEPDASAAGDDLAVHAAPLLGAHDALRAYAEAVAAGAGQAETTAAWREADAAVEAALEGSAEGDTAGLGPAQRSALRGFEGGLRLARDAWADVEAAIQAGDAAARDRGAASAADRMRHLDSLRAGIE